MNDVYSTSPEKIPPALTLFLRFLGVVYALAFGSLLFQVKALYGSAGVVPISQLLDMVVHVAGNSRWWYVPSVFWFSSSDTAVVAVPLLGLVLSALLIAGVVPVAVLAGNWLLYLSLVSVGGDFLSFQWDALLLETGFLAIFLAPLSWRLKSGLAPRRELTWLLRWLFFRLMFSSGIVKLASGDPTWRSLRALTFHYETQPLPTWVGWWAHQLPAGIQTFSCGAMFVVELLLPFAVFAPRRVRNPVMGVMIAFQLVVALTGNYCFFNLLAIALALSLMDLALVEKMFPAAENAQGTRWPRWVTFSLFTLLLSATIPAFFGRFVTGLVPAPVGVVFRVLTPLRIANPYGLFAIMTTRRREITLQGSADGKEWKDYEFRYKPGDPWRRPGFVAPHQPRLDWQMWFAALGTAEDNRWFTLLCVRLLQGSPTVLRLFRTNPFEDAPPRFVRATLAEYKFTTPAERRETGAWWKVGPAELYSPPVQLRDEVNSALGFSSRTQK